MAPVVMPEGDTTPLKIVDVHVKHEDGFMMSDRYEIQIVLNRQLDAIETRVARREIALPDFTFGSNYLATTKRTFAEIKPARVIEFLDEFNARVAQRRGESASAQERVRAMGQQLNDALQAEQAKG